MTHRLSRRQLLAMTCATGSALLAACRREEATPTPGPAAGTPATGMRFDGVEVNVITFTGPQIAEPLQRRAPEFQQLTGAKINVITVPFADLYQKILTDFTTGTNSYHVIVFAPQWMADYVEPGYLEDLTPRIEADPALQWDDIAPFFRNFSATYGGKIYTIPLDGDFQMVYYRSDLLEAEGLKPPETWEDYLAIAQRFHGKDLNGDGVPDFGSGIAKRRGAQSYWMFWSIAASFLQSQGTQQGSFFDADTMEPLTNNEAFARALEIYKETGKYGPPDELNWDVGDSRAAFVTGRCALTIDWGDIGTLAIDPEQSKVKDKVGAIILPGSKEVWDRSAGKIVTCDANTCPHAINGVNHAPYAAFGGWSGAINKNAPAKVKDAGYAFLSYMSQPAQANVDVTIGRTGFNPYRTSQFENIDLWVKAGMSEAAARNYLGAIKDSLNSPNMVLDLRIPGAQRYQGVVLDTVLSRYLAGELTTKQAMEELTKGWNEITNELGREKQKQAYRSSLSIR
ncbi:MAG: extracellular solute-binding protein [Thermomicrobium sp.]|nr:extracellular solute-binding protein [Thermomicrobium sp.]MDW8007024.1 extracellular solute-binding protein [Thermomicrobium sp.]